MLARELALAGVDVAIVEAACQPGPARCLREPLSRRLGALGIR
jgi:hypothetical protein